MEQGKGADGLIAPLAKAASARWILALAVAVVLLFVLPGCGGEDSEDAAGSPAASERSSQASLTQPESSSAASANPQSGESGATANPQASSGGGGKQGPPVSLPQGAPEPGLSAEQRERAKVASIALESPAIPPGTSGPGLIPTPYTCEGKDSWPELRWQGVPAETEELVLFAMSLAPVEGKLFFDWAVAGIDPGLESIEAGRLPKGSVTGRNGFGRNGYSICPEQGAGETYFFALYALPKRLSARQGFDPHALRKQVQEISRDVGILSLAYARPE